MGYKLCVLLFIACLSSCYATYYNYDYMDDSSICWGSTVYLSSSSQGVKVSAWSPYSISKTPLSGGCEITISSYGSYGLKYKFSSDSYISSSDVTFKVYDGSSTYYSTLDSYSWLDSFSTYYTYTSSGYITIKLRNPSQSTNFRLTIQVENYDDISNYYYWDAGRIVGTIIGTIVFIIVISVVSVCVRRRRILARTTIIRTQAPVSQVTTSAQINYPVAHPPPYSSGQAPYPAGKPAYPAPGAAYPAATTAMPQP